MGPVAPTETASAGGSRVHREREFDNPISDDDSARPSLSPRWGHAPSHAPPNLNMVVSSVDAAFRADKALLTDLNPAKDPLHCDVKSGRSSRYDQLNRNRSSAEDGVGRGNLLARLEKKLVHTLTNKSFRGIHSSARPQQLVLPPVIRGQKVDVSLEDVLLSKEVAMLREVKGQAHEPSHNLLMWLAAVKAKESTVVPETIAELRGGGRWQIEETQPGAACQSGATGSAKKAEKEGREDKDSYLNGERSLFMRLFRWSYYDCDVPSKLILEEENVDARRQILNSVMIDPDSDFRQAWDVVQVVLLLSMAISLPLKVGFSEPDPEMWSFSFWLQVIVDIYFLVDIYLSFLMCFYDVNGRLITSRRVIAAKYLKGWFLIDVLSCLPVGYIGYFANDILGLEEQTTPSTVATGSWEAVASMTGDSAGTGSDSAALKLLKLTRLVKLLRLARLKRLKKKYETQFYEIAQKIKAINLLLMIAIFGHWIACIWYFVGTLDKEGWVVTYVKLNSQFGPDVKLEDLSCWHLWPLCWHELYLASYWMAIGTLISGAVPTDVNSATVAELVFGLLAIVTGGFVYGNVIGNITELTRKNNMESDIHDIRSAQARAMCRGAKADEWLTQKIASTVQYDSDARPVMDVHEFVKSLPSNLEMDFAGQLGWIPQRGHGVFNNGILHKIPFFTHLDHRSKIAICDKLCIQSFDPFDPEDFMADVGTDRARPITVEGQPGGDMYVILDGNVQVMQEHETMGCLEQHHFFGERCILLPQRIGSFGQLHLRTHYAVERRAEVASLGYEDFMELRRSRPEINDAVLPYIKEMLGKQLHSNNWFYVCVDSASNLTAMDSSTLERSATSDPYCVMFLNNVQIAKTLVHPQTLDPVWGVSAAFTRNEHRRMCRDGDEKMQLKFNVYDADFLRIGDPRLIGSARATMTTLSGLDEFSQFTEHSPTHTTELELYDPDVCGGEPVEKCRTCGTEDFGGEGTCGTCGRVWGRDAKTGQPRKSIVRVSISNTDKLAHTSSHFNDPLLITEIKRRQARMARRAVHLSDTAADIADIQTRLSSLESKMDRLLAAVEK